MGSHRARHRADQNNSEELATDLLARLADEVRPPSARTRHAAERPALDPFSTAPFPARTPAAEDGAPAQPGSTPPGPNSAQPHPAQPDGTQPGIPRPRTAAPDTVRPHAAQRDGAHPAVSQPGTAQRRSAPILQSSVRGECCRWVSWMVWVGRCRVMPGGGRSRPPTAGRPGSYSARTAQQQHP